MTEAALTPGKLWRLHLLKRIRSSLENPQLLGEEGARRRYLKLQWWVLLWRLLILLQIPLVAIVMPSRFTKPLAWEFLLMALALTYSILFYWLATRTGASGKKSLHYLDLAACAGLLLVAGDEKLIFVFLYFSFSSLMARPTTLLRDALYSSFFLSVVYVVSRWMIGDYPWLIHTNAKEMGGVALLFFWGIGMVGFSAVMERAAALELDSRLEEERRAYRRRLHDDLGNTICGLHFKIQSLSRASQGELKQSLEFLTVGYERANAVLKRLLSGMDEEEDRDLGRTLENICREVQEASGIEVRLSLPGRKKDISLELGREVCAIVREAVTNAAQHSGAGRIGVELRRRRGQLIVTIADDGCGIAREVLEAHQAAGSMGVKGMKERASLMNADFNLDSAAGNGTRIELRLDIHGQSGLLARALDSDPQSAGGGIFPYLVRLRMAMYVWTMIQLLFQPAGQQFTVAVLVVSAGLSLDVFAWRIWRQAVCRAVSKRPWLLVLENLFFAILLYITLQAGFPFFFSLYVGMAVIMNGPFLGTAGNLAATAVLNAAILIAYGLAPAELVGLTAGARYEPALQHVVIFLILALSSGLAGEFVLGLENLQLEAVGRALSRQRERLASATHRQLHDLVLGLGREIHQLRERFLEAPGAMESGRFAKIESSSADLKTRLRSIVASIEK